MAMLAVAAPSAPSLCIRGLSHRYGDREVLNGFDLDLARGEWVGLLGPNGSGKSTVLGLISGLVTRQSGTITFEGAVQPLGGPTRTTRAAMGVVFQSPSLDPKLSARQNLELAASMHGLRAPDVATRVSAELNAVGLADRADSRVLELSGGMRRRIDVARAMLHRPRLLLLDEPTANLDPESKHRAQQIIQRMMQKKTVICITHDPEMMTIFPRVYQLTEGVLVEKK